MKVKIGDMVKFRKGKTIATGKIVAEYENSIGKCFVIKMTGKFKGSGHTCEGIYDTCDYWHSYESMIVSVEPREEIHITRDGDTVHAIMKKDGKVTYRSKAVCSPEDEFDFLIGSTLAYNRLIVHTGGKAKADPEPEYVEIVSNSASPKHYFNEGDVCKVVSRYNVYLCVERITDSSRQYVSNLDFIPIKPVKRAAKAGEYIMLIKESFSFNEIGDVLKVNHNSGNHVEVLPEDHPERESLCYSFIEVDGHWNYAKNDYVVLEGYKPPKKFVPHLEDIDDGENYGTIGEKTPMKDNFGNELFVGDLVMSILPEDPTHRYYNFVVRPTRYNADGKAFVMGIEMNCKVTGKIEDAVVLKIKSYTEAHDGEHYDGIKAVLKE